MNQDDRRVEGVRKRPLIAEPNSRRPTEKEKSRRSRELATTARQTVGEQAGGTEPDHSALALPTQDPGTTVIRTARARRYPGQEGNVAFNHALKAFAPLSRSINRKISCALTVLLRLMSVA